MNANNTTDSGGMRVIVIDEETFESDQDTRPVDIYENGLLGTGGEGRSGAAVGGGDAASGSSNASSSSFSGRPVPKEFALAPGYPNPVQAGRRVTVPFALPEATEVTLEVYDVLGRPVRRIERGTVGAGHPRIVVGTEDLSGGVYIYRLTAGEHFSGTGKLVVVK